MHILHALLCNKLKNRKKIINKTGFHMVMCCFTAFSSLTGDRIFISFQRIFSYLVINSQTMIVRIVWLIRSFCWQIHRWCPFPTTNSSANHKNIHRACHQHKRTPFQRASLWKWLTLRFHRYRLNKRNWKINEISFRNSIGEFECSWTWTLCVFFSFIVFWKWVKNQYYHIRPLLVDQTNRYSSKTRLCHLFWYRFRNLVCWGVLVVLVEPVVDYRSRNLLQHQPCGLHWTLPKSYFKTTTKWNEINTFEVYRKYLLAKTQW